VKRIILDDLKAPRLSSLQRLVRSSAKPGRIDFTEAAVLDAARRRTGLSDFGPDDFRERLNLLLADYAADRNLNAFGQQALFNDLVRFTSNRLLIQDQFKRHPEILDEKIEAPIIVAGLPRSGTTHLLNLLAADTRFRSLPLWLAQEPVPPPGDAGLHRLLRGAHRLLARSADTHKTDPRWLRSAARWTVMQRLVPHLAAMHPMEPDHIHEELELMLPDFASYQFEWTGKVPRYCDHARRMDQAPHYAYMKNVLKLLQWRQPRKRWVLKCPQHLERLPVLFKTFPDATIVVTHRDPVAVIQSTITMLAYAERMTREAIDTDGLARYWIERIEDLLRACVRDRDSLPAAQSLDCPFHLFMADDRRMVESIYAKAGIEMTETASQQLQRYTAEHPRGKHGEVVYELKRQFGVDPDVLRERFKFYFERFPIKVEGKPSVTTLPMAAALAQNT